MRWKRAPPDALAGPSLPGGGPKHALHFQLKGRDISFGQAPPWLCVQAVPQGASARPQLEGSMRWCRRPRTLSLVLLCPAAVPTMLFHLR